MSALPTEVSCAGALDVASRIRDVRLRLADASADLRPLPGADDIGHRVQAVAAQLEKIVHDLRLVIHLSELDSSAFRTELADIDKRLADGWVPDGSPVADVVARLQASP